MGFTAKDVKDLREKTGCGMMDCKKALMSSDGDMNKAIDFLREKGLAAAEKKSGRSVLEGLAVAYTNGKNDTGVAIEVNTETDFVSRNSNFQDFVKLCVETIFKENCKDIEELLKTKASGKNETIEDILKEKILTIGENIKIRRFVKYEGVISTYIHAEGKIGVMVKFDVDDKSKINEQFNVFAKDIAMQIAASNPLYLNKDLVPEEVINHERKILKEQVVNSGKPENIAEKIVEGKLGKFYKEICLMDQMFVKDNDINIKQYVEKISKELGTIITINSFVRFERGEGLDKK